jgi:hypothetical protein
VYIFVKEDGLGHGPIGGNPRKDAKKGEEAKVRNEYRKGRR